MKHVPGVLETRSKGGYTPLHLAFSLHHTKHAKILIESGANQAVRDSKGNNIVHLLFCNIKGNRNGNGNTQTLLDLIDPLLVHSLLIERSSDFVGHARRFVTPLHRWMRAGRGYWKSRETRVKEVKALSLILEFGKPTGQKQLELLDEEGNTPLHDVVKESRTDLLKLMVDERPDLLHRENVLGSTPFELATNIWLINTTTNEPEINLDAGRREEWLPIDFVKPWHFVHKEDRKRATYELCCRKLADMHMQDTMHMKRRLVSFYEANEVASRLEADPEESPRNNRKEEDDDEKDEVDRWYGNH